MEKKSDIVIIGGGIAGCALFYGLAKNDADVVLLEGDKIGAGLSSMPPRALQLLARRIHNFDASNIQTLQNMFLHHIERLAGHNFFHYQDPEKQSDDAMICFGNDDDRQWLKQILYDTEYMYSVVNLARHLIPKEKFDKHNIPLIDPDKSDFILEYLLQIFLIKPKETLLALIKLAGILGKQYHEDSKVTEIAKNADGSWRVTLADGTSITANHVVNAAGNHAPQIAEMAGFTLPLRKVAHYCFLLKDSTDFFDDDKVTPNYLSLSDDFYLYIDRPNLVLNFFPKQRRIIDDENPLTFKGKPVTYGEKIACSDADFPELADDFARIYRVMPQLKDRISHYIPSAMLTTPDNQPLIGAANIANKAEQENFWLACGFIEGFSQVIALEAGLVHKILDKDYRTDTVNIDIFHPARFGNYTDEWLEKNIILNPNFKHYDDDGHANLHRAKIAHPLTAEYQKINTPLMTQWGYATPAFFNKNSKQKSPHPQSAHPKDNFQTINDEQLQLRKEGGYYDIGHHAKIAVTGKDAEKFVNFVSVGKAPGLGEMKVAPLVNQAGKLEVLFTLGHIAQNHFWLIGSHDKHQTNFHYLQTLQARYKFDVTLENLTDKFSGIAVAGPQAKALVSDFFDADMRFLNIRQEKINQLDCVIVRFSITGEQGYEIYAANADMAELYGLVASKAEKLNLKPIGYYAIQALRLEAGFASSYEFQNNNNLYMLGMGKYIDFAKDDFLHKDILLKQQAAKHYAIFHHLKIIRLGMADIYDLDFRHEAYSNKHIDFIVMDEQNLFDISKLYFRHQGIGNSLAFAANSNTIYGFGWLNLEPIHTTEQAYNRHAAIQYHLPEYDGLSLMMQTSKTFKIIHNETIK